MFACTLSRQLGMETTLMARQQVYVSVALFIMTQRPERRIPQRTAYAVIFFATQSQETRFRSQVYDKNNYYLEQTEINSLN